MATKRVPTHDDAGHMGSRDRSQRGVALVTGAGNGLGELLARRLAARGMDLALFDLDAERLATVSDGIRDRDGDVAVLTYAVDVADASALAAALSGVRERFGSVEVCAPFAGLFSSPDLERGSEFGDLVHAVNVVHVVTCCEWAQDAAAANRRPCHLVLSGSVSGVTRHPADAYARSKQELMLVALRLRRRGRRLARSTGAKQAVTLAIIHATRTRFGANSESVGRLHLGDDGERAREFEELDRFLEAGSDPESVIDDLLAAVDQGRRTVQLTGGEPVSARKRFSATVVIPAVALLAERSK